MWVIPYYNNEKNIYRLYKKVKKLILTMKFFIEYILNFIIISITVQFQLNIIFQSKQKKETNTHKSIKHGIY